jgi:hypothetical protein
MSKPGRTKRVKPISFDRGVYEFLLTLQNASEYVNDAVIEKKTRNTTPEQKIRELQQEKRDLAIKITKLTAEEEKIKEKLR